MTKVKVTKTNNHITAVEAFGHTGYGTSGEDIVCAALSSIIQTAALGILSVAKVQAKTKRNDKEGYFSLHLPDNLSQQERQAADAILNTMLVGVSDLKEGYSNFIELEVLENVY
jgi:uncharacterized protein YsxB (DUF464 family)